MLHAVNAARFSYGNGEVNLRQYLAALAVAIFALMGSSAQANVTYNFFGGSVGTGSFSGSITTDGALGLLVTASILDWNITLDGTPGGTFTLRGPLSGNNSAYLSTDNILFTTASGGLFADFAASGFAAFQNPSLGSGMNYLCFVGSTTLCGGFDGPAITLGTYSSTFGMNQRVVEAALIQIGSSATAVPEPEMVALLGIGLLGLIATHRARRT